jgi:predicted MFS family arabinose efflux permease
MSLRLSKKFQLKMATTSPTSPFQNLFCAFENLGDTVGMSSTSTPPILPLDLSPTQERWLLWTLAAINLTHIMDFMIMMPLGPQLTQLFKISDAQFGWLVSAYTLAAGASGLLATSYIDRFERKSLLMSLYLAFAASTLACGLASSYGSLMAARIAAGVFGGVLGALVQTIVADAIPFERRGRAMGVVMTAFSVSTVLGVPVSLWLAHVLGWQAPFIMIAGLSVLVVLLALRVMPRLDQHLAADQRARSAFGHLNAVLREPNHWRAFFLTILVMTAGFSIIPFITLYAVQNVHIKNEHIPVVYLVGGVATLFSARLWGYLSDRWGKVSTFRLVAAASMVPMLALTHLPVVPLPVFLIVTTLFFVFVSGRMIPSMALISSATSPMLRGAFMSLNSSLQSASMGIAALVGGLLIHRDAAGQILGYGWSGWLSVGLSILALWWVSHIRSFGHDKN